MASVLFQDKGRPRPVLDSSSGPVVTEALMPESPPEFPHHLPSAGTANPQENERVPHVQDFVSNAANTPGLACFLCGRYSSLAEEQLGLWAKRLVLDGQFLLGIVNRMQQNQIPVALLPMTNDRQL